MTYAFRQVQGARRRYVRQRKAPPYWLARERKAIEQYLLFVKRRRA